MKSNLFPILLEQKSQRFGILLQPSTASVGNVDLGLPLFVNIKFTSKKKKYVFLLLHTRVLAVPPPPLPPFRLVPVCGRSVGGPH